jgi:hypothetical protein
VLESLEIKKCSMFPRCDLGKYEDVDGAADVEMLKDPCVLENDVWLQKDAISTLEWMVACARSQSARVSQQGWSLPCLKVMEKPCKMM